MTDNFNDTIDWKKMQEQAAQSNPATTNYTKPSLSTDVFFKMGQGLNEFRIIPAGNREEKLPFKLFYRHDIKVPTSKGIITVFHLCYNYILTNNEGIRMPLINAQKLTREDDELAQKYGCPYCRAKTEMINKNVVKETWTKLNAKETWMWNVLSRKDDKMYIWTCSSKQGRNVKDMANSFIKKNLNPFDPVAGYDYQITRTGEDINTRYSGGMFMPIGVPMITEAMQRRGVTPQTMQHPHSLTVAVMDQFRPYQECIDTLNRAFGDVLAHIDYKVPGDSADWANRQSPRQGSEPSPWGNATVTGREQSQVPNIPNTPQAAYFNSMVPPSEEPRIIGGNTPQAKQQKDDPFKGTVHEPFRGNF